MKSDAPVAPPAWKVVGFWDYDGADGQHLAQGLVLLEKPGDVLGVKWQRRLELKNHGKLRKRNRQLWPVQLNRTEKRVCIDAPYPTHSGYVHTADDRFDGTYTFASCKGGN